MKIPEYKDLKEKKKAFGDNYQRIDTVDDLLSVIDEYKISKGKNVFRGVCEAKYKNYSSAQRYYVVNDLNTTGVTLESLIRQHINELSRHKNNKSKNLLPRFYESLGTIQNDLLFLSFAQHYGGISPLLDFTRNINTALFFMTKNSKFTDLGGDDIDNYFSIYCLPVKGYHQELRNKREEEVVNSLKFENMILKSPLIITDKAISIREMGKKTIISFSNLNIIRQEGCFVFYFDTNNPTKPLEQELYCVDIHKSLLPYIQEKILVPKGFTETYLFPKEEDLAKLALRETVVNII